MDEHKEAINVEEAKHTIVEAYPELHGLPVAVLDEGWDFRLVEVGKRWLFRFPKREMSLPKLEMERRLLADLHERVSLPVPHYEYYGRSGVRSGWPFAGYRKLPGVPGDRLETVDRPKVARQLGRFLGALHAYPLDKAGEAGVPRKRDMVAHWRNRALEGLTSGIDFEADAHRLYHYLVYRSPPPYEGRPRLVHNDLWAEHILVDPHSGSVSGIIDWGDAAIGDPAVDFAGLYTWYGESWLGLALQSYPGTSDPELMSRARYLATCQAVHSIALGQAGGLSRWIEAGERVLRWIFAECPASA